MPDFSTECPSEETLECNPFNVLTGIGKIVSFQGFYDFAGGVELEVDGFIKIKNLIGLIIFFGLILVNINLKKKKGSELRLSISE